MFCSLARKGIMLNFQLTVIRYTSSAINWALLLVFSVLGSIWFIHSVPSFSSTMNNLLMRIFISRIRRINLERL